MQAEPDYPTSGDALNKVISQQVMSSALCTATWNNNMEVIRRLSEQEREIDRTRNTGFNRTDIILPCGFGPLHFAAALGNIEVLNYVLDNNLGNKNARDKDGKTPLMWVIASNGSEELMEALIDHGADVNMQDFAGETALSYATSRGMCDQARLLLENGANVEIANIDGVTPLHSAANGGYVDVCELLVQYGAFVNAGDDEDDRPLHYAVREGHQDIVKLLLESGADLELRNSDAETPLALAVCLEDKEMVAFLFSMAGKISNSTSPRSAVRSPTVDMMEAELKNLSVVEMEACTNSGVVAAKRKGKMPSSFGTTPPVTSFVC